MNLVYDNRIFRDMPQEAVNEVLEHGQRRMFPKGTQLVLPQQELTYFGIVLSGMIHDQFIFSDGTYSLMNVLEPGDLFGADLICTRTRISPYYAVAVQQTQLLLFPAEILENGVLTEANRMLLLQNILRIVADETIRKDYRLAILSQKGLRARIMTYLAMQASKRGSSTFSIPFSREDLASFLCVNRSALSHELSLMEQEGILSFRKNKFTLHKTTSGS